MVKRAVAEYNSNHPHSQLLFMNPDECERKWDDRKLIIYDKLQLEITRQKVAYNILVFSGLDQLLHHSLIVFPIGLIYSVRSN